MSATTNETTTRADRLAEVLGEVARAEVGTRPG